MNFSYNNIFVAQKLSEWQTFKDCPLLLMRLCVRCKRLAGKCAWDVRICAQLC